MKPDLAKLRHVIECGIKDAARDAGLRSMVLDVVVDELPPDGAAVHVLVVSVTPEQAAAIAAEQATEQAAEQRRRDAGN